VILPVLLFLLQITLAVQGLLCFHLKFRIDFSMSMKSDIGILIRITLNLNIALDHVVIFVLILRNHEHGGLSIWFLKFLSSRFFRFHI
jgi:hypothetical protein